MTTIAAERQQLAVSAGVEARWVSADLDRAAVSDPLSSPLWSKGRKPIP